MTYVDAINRACELTERAERIRRALRDGRAFPGDERRMEQYRKGAEQALHSAERMRLAERERCGRMLSRDLDAIDARESEQLARAARWVGSLATL